MLYKDNRLIWTAGTFGAGSELRMQSNGQARVINGYNIPIWFSTGDKNDTGNAENVREARLVVQDDGNAYIYTNIALKWCTRNDVSRLEADALFE